VKSVKPRARKVASPPVHDVVLLASRIVGRRGIRFNGVALWDKRFVPYATLLKRILRRPTIREYEARVAAIILSFKFYCMFYFTCDRSLSDRMQRGGRQKFRRMLKCEINSCRIPIVSARCPCSIGLLRMGRRGSTQQHALFFTID